MARAFVLLCALALSRGAVPALAQSEVASAEARSAQFVFVIDDSGSMKDTDPDRLAIFAVQSLIGMLDDGDEVSLVRLNGTQEGDAPPPIEPLRKNRAAIERLLSLDSRLAGYPAESTRCRSALATTGKLLEAAYRPGVAQVVFFLTDGACTPAGEQPAVDTFLQGLRSHQEALFQFYLLRFRGKEFTPALADLTHRTDGEDIVVDGADPTAILHPFATALSRSQGYEAYMLTPGASRLAAHRGAERVRLLAVAPGAGPDLALTIRDRQGGSLAATGRSSKGAHRYENGRVFRFAALDYRPGAEPVTIGVEGAGEGWKVVAVPEYRLRIRLGVHQGTCDALGPPARFGVDTGSTVCVVTELVNAAGRVVDSEVTGGELKAGVRIRRPGQPASEAAELAANPLSPNQARFGLLRSNLTKGDYELQPFVTLALSSGDAVRLRGRAMTLEVSSVVILPQPSQLDFGAVQPGDTVDRRVVFTGSFPQVPGTVELRDRSEIPACISVELNGAPEGKPQEILVDQRYNFVLRVAPYCGPRSLSPPPFETAIRLVFDTGEGGRPLPTVELPVRFQLRYHIQTPPELAIRLTGGEVADVPLEVKGNFRGDVQLRAVIAEPGDEEVVWPEDQEHLVLGFAAAGKTKVLRKDGDLQQEHDFVAGTGAAALRLRTQAHRCCGGGSYETRLGLVPAAGQPLPPGAPALEPILIPVRVEVVPAGVWVCYGVLLLWILAALLALLLLLYLASMFRNSSFLRADGLATRLQPLVWTGYGDTVEQKNTKHEVQRLAHAGLPWTRRALNWLRANPLRFGLPGGRYQESVELFLQPHRDVARSQISLVPERDLEKKLAAAPESFGGRLFATAAGGVTFLGVPDTGGRMSRLVHQNGFIPGTADGAKPRVVKLRRAKLLKHLEDWESYQEDAAAGWQVG
jgi:von Willebrand factor type A domain